MTGRSINLFLGAVFVLLGALNVSLILHASRALTTSRMNQRLIQAHRLGRYLFIALFCLMSYFMALRTTDQPDEHLDLVTSISGVHSERRNVMSCC